MAIFKHVGNRRFGNPRLLWLIWGHLYLAFLMIGPASDGGKPHRMCGRLPACTCRTSSSHRNGPCGAETASFGLRSEVPKPWHISMTHRPSGKHGAETLLGRRETPGGKRSCRERSIKGETRC